MKKQDLTARNAELETENSVLSCALNDVLNGAVTWFGRAPYRVGISRANGASGGIAIVCAEGMTSAYYFEQWAREAHAHFSACLTGKADDYNRDLLRRRDVIEAASKFVRESQRAA